MTIFAMQNQFKMVRMCDNGNTLGDKIRNECFLNKLESALNDNTTIGDHLR